jgi:type IV secretory pathway VirB10-like protein
MSEREQDTTRQPAPPGMVRDVRQPPRGVLPRQLQMWLMAGLAVVILLIILVTGRTQPTPRTAASAGSTAAPTPATADRIRSYQRQLADEQARQEQLDQQQRAVESRVSAPRTSPTQAAAPADPLMDEQHRRDYQSLFATNVSFSRRTNGSTDGETRSASARSETPPVASTPAVSSSGVQSNAVTEARSAGTERDAAAAEPVRAEHPATGPRLPLAEGTVIETALINRLEGTFAGPVLCLVTTPVYSQNRQHVLIPAGARVIGTSSPVQSWGDSRLAVTFHRLAMPDGHAYSLDRFKGLNQIGETGLRDEVNRHYLQVFGASLAIGAISGLAQFNTRSGFDYSFSDASRQAMGASLATSTSRVLDRYLNVLPTITIREGFRIKVYLTNDFELPVYEPEKDGAQ